MNEDMSDMIKNLSSMLNGKEMPEDIKNIINNFASNNSNHNNSNYNNNSQTNNHCNNSQHNDDISSDSRNNSSNSNEKSSPDIDIGMILKMKQIMDSMKSNKDDPRANLLLSLKPYLKNSRQEKVDQYIKLFNMSKVFEVINPLGGDTKNGI
ncbi:MAG: hypothetical protein HFJ20_04810 [Clostridia bacterium]|nr:hypothetical protein [Clostridia bacterium]